MNHQLRPSAYQLNAAELGMLSAVARQSLCDAWMCGEDLAQFRGYCIEARRIRADGDGHVFVLTLRAVGSDRVLDRLFIAVAQHSNSGAIFDNRRNRMPTEAVGRAESPVGCVSPFDARNASPETGHFS